MPTQRWAQQRQSCRTIGALIIALAALGVGCGGDELNRTEFLALTTQGDGGLSRSVANCVFDRVESDDLVLGELRDKGPRSTELSDTVNSRMETFVAACILASSDTKVADDPQRTTTTAAADQG